MLVCADTVLCLGQMNESKEAKARWEGQVEGLRMYPSHPEAVRINGDAIEFEWNIYPGFSSLAFLPEIQEDLASKNINPDLTRTTGGKALFLSVGNALFSSSS